MGPITKSSDAMDSVNIGTDAEVIYNLIQIYILEQEYKKAQEMIAYFNKYQESLKFIDKKPDFYQTKISLFEKFIKAKKLFQIRK